MIALPSLGPVPGIVSAAPSDRLAARCALALAAPGPIPSVRRRKDSIEHTLLALELEAALFKAGQPLRIFRPRMHLHLGGVPTPCACSEGAAQPITVFLANSGGNSFAESRWLLERRWRELERVAPGLAPTALRALDDQAVVPVYTPRRAMHLAQWVYWHGESDEREALAMVRDEDGPPDETEGAKPLTDEDLAERYGFITKAQIDRALPPEVTEPRRGLGIDKVERIAAGRGPAKEAARRTAALIHAMKAQPAEKHALHDRQDETFAFGFGAALRWNARDPMYRIADDWGNHIIEGATLEEAWGWFVLKGPGELRGFVAHLEERLAVARLVEDLIEAIAERTKA